MSKIQKWIDLTCGIPCSKCTIDECAVQNARETELRIIKRHKEIYGGDL
jgi:hypothetical protein